MREGGEGEDGRMTPVEMTRETLEIQSNLLCSWQSQCWKFLFPLRALRDQYSYFRCVILEKRIGLYL